MLTHHRAARQEELEARGEEPPRPFRSPWVWAGYACWGDGFCSGKIFQQVGVPRRARTVRAGGGTRLGSPRATLGT